VFYRSKIILEAEIFKFNTVKVRRIKCENGKRVEDGQLRYISKKLEIAVE